MNELRKEYNLSGIQQLIEQLLDAEGISEFELSRRAGLNPATIYNMMNEKKTDENQSSRGMRKLSLRKIGESLGYRVTFDTQQNEIILTRVRSSASGMDELEGFWVELRTVFLQAGKFKLTPEEQTRIKDIIKAVIS